MTKSAICDTCRNEQNEADQKLTREMEINWREHPCEVKECRCIRCGETKRWWYFVKW